MVLEVIGDKSNSSVMLGGWNACRPNLEGLNIWNLH